MEAAERLEWIAQRGSSYPESLTAAIYHYAAGDGALSTVQQAWQKSGRRGFLGQPFFLVFSYVNAKQLDEMDLRVLDICIVTGTISSFFSTIAAAGPVAQAHDYLLARGIGTQEVIKAITDSRSLLDFGRPNGLGRQILSYLPNHFDEVLQYLASTNNPSARQNVFRLLFNARPAGYIDLAWQLAQATALPEADEYAAELMQADPARMTEWAREVARASMQHDQRAAYPTLKALLEVDPARNIDVALEAVHAPLGRSRQSQAILQRTGLEAAYRLDPERYLSLVAEASVASNVDLGTYAVGLLKKADFEQARSVLQHCISNGEIEVAVQALSVLLKHDWAERQAYVLSLLSHRSKRIRDMLVVWLGDKGESVITPLSPYVAHPQRDARLAAVQALQRIGSEQARSLLTARLAAEKSLEVKQAILDALGGRP